MDVTSLAPAPPPSLGRRLWRFSRYLILGGIANTIIWTGTLHFLKNTPPTYRSTVLLNVVGGGPGVNVNLPNIGQAVTSSQSSFSSAHSDPRDNYKELIMGSTVMVTAAEALEMAKGDLGKPNISLVANTTLMSIEMEAQSPEQSQAKTQAVYDALVRRIDQLRTGEQAERDKATQKALDIAQQKLTAAQQKVSAYKSTSGLNSSDQVKTLIMNIEQLRQKQAEAVATQLQSQQSMYQLAQTLNVTPQQAADALTLQADQEFQKSLSGYTDATLKLLALESYRGRNYPDVVAARSKRQQAEANLVRRGQALLRKTLQPHELHQLTLNHTTGSSSGSGSNRGTLYKALIEEEARLQGLGGEVSGITSEIGKLERLLRDRTRKESVLDSLLRDLQIAEAVFAATLAKIDLGKGDPFASYPLMQMIEKPSLPTDPSAPKKGLVFAGSLMGSILITLGLTLIWYRQPLVSASQKLVRGIVE